MSSKSKASNKKTEPKASPPPKAETKKGFEVAKFEHSIVAKDGEQLIIVRNADSGGLSHKNGRTNIDVNHVVEPLNVYVNREAQKMSDKAYTAFKEGKRDEKLMAKWTKEWEEGRLTRRKGTLAIVNEFLKRAGIAENPFTTDHIAFLE